MKADLHTHTNASDGFLNRQQLLRFAQLNGLDAVAVTDHDTMRNSYSLPSDPIRVIEGVELSAMDPENGRKVHILCYRPKRPEVLTEYMDYMQEERRRAGEVMLEKLRKRFPVISDELLEPYLAQSAVFYKQYAMQILQDYGYTTEIYGPLYGELFDDPYGSCFEQLNYGEMREVARIARKADGVVVFAHPSVYRSMQALEKMAAEGEIDGIEVYHPRNTEEDMETMMQLAARHGLIITGGSDYHARTTKRTNIIGSCTAPEETVRLLLER